MALSVPSDQVSVIGVTACSHGKPTGFQYQAICEQKRIAGFDAQGFRVLGVPVPYGKDIKFSVSYTGGIHSIIGEMVPEACEDSTNFNISFLLADGGNLSFTCGSCVVDGQGMSADPLNDSANLGFIALDTATAGWA